MKRFALFMPYILSTIASMENVPNKNISRPFRARAAEGLDRKWLEAAVDDIKKIYALGKQNENPFSLPLPWETKADIKALRRAQRVLAKGHDKQSNKPLIEALEQKIARLSTRLSWTAPRGRQMDYVLDMCVFCLAESIKVKTGSFHWGLIADVISERLGKDMSANRALKAHRRVEKLSKDKANLTRLIAANTKFLITKNEVEQKIKESATSRSSDG